MYDFSQESAVLVMLKMVLRQERRMEWLMVSNDALRSSRIRMLRFPALQEGRR